MADRGPRVKLALLAPVVLGAAVAVAVLMFVRPGAEAPDPLEAHSGEEGVVSSVFLPMAQWNPDTGMIEVAAIVTARAESGGVCRLEATDGEIVLSTETDATADASTTTCGTMSVGEGAAPGTWQVTVSYRKGSFEIRSDPVEVEVTE